MSDFDYLLDRSFAGKDRQSARQPFASKDQSYVTSRGAFFGSLHSTSLEWWMEIQMLIWGQRS